jgi:flagellar biosynthesis/type III secretory pathway protein FliH
VEKLKTYCRELMGESSANCRFVADDCISPGGLKVVCDDGQIDATIQTQWHNMISALLGDDAAAAGMPAGAPTGNQESE